MFCIIRASSQSPSTIIHLAWNVDKRGRVLMLIIPPNLKHSFISPVPVPVPVPDYGFRSRIQLSWSSIRPSEHNREVADRYISNSTGLIIFTAHSSKLSSITMFSCTYKLFFGDVTRFLGLPIS